ncbi:MAG TPA: potassium channel protein [Candidatus Krumholzibacteria bacterium]|nr:potassium channel protein [Candidatus Krumholzibacteria bacterium]
MFERSVSFQNVIRGVVVMVLVLVAGTIWFTGVEGYRPLDALYMTVITVSTVGFREVHDLDTSGRVFVIILIITGLTVMTYTLGSIGQVVVEGSIQRYLGRQRMLRDIDKLRGHYVVCGHGRMGQILCEELQSENVPFVVVEGDHDTAEQLAARGYRVVEGDATEDETLRRAGVTRAKGLVAVVSRDVDNLYVVLSAREMCRDENPGLYILCRATDQRAGEKMSRAGASRVISPYVIGGMRIVQALLRPTVYDFVDIATQRSGLDLMFEEVRIAPGSRLDGVSVKDSDIRKHYDVIVIAIQKADRTMVFNPGPDSVMHGGDVLITLGDRHQLQKLAATLPA